MTPLTPEKRLDKNGVLVTRHVRTAATSGSDLSAVPPPKLSSGGKVRAKAFKPRPAQLEQQRYAISSTMNPISEELLKDVEWKPASNMSFAFAASEVEVYAVLSVARPGDAALLLSRGVRTADEARDYLKSHGAEHKAVKRTLLTEDALKRGILSYDFMNRMNLALIAHPDDDTTDNAMDVLELSTISALSDQWGWVAREVRSGAIRLEDIKHLGVTKLKSFRRLVNVKDALLKVREPDAQFTMDDLKYLVDRSARDSLPKEHFSRAAAYLVDEGVDGLKKLDSLKMIRLIVDKYRGEKRFERVTYEIDFRHAYEQETGARPKDTDLTELFDAGVPADRAAELISEGMTVRSAIGVAMGGTGKAIADGWL